MHPYEIRELRAALADGEAVAPEKTEALLAEIEALRRRIDQPTELHLTARVDIDRPDRWVIDHPRLMSTVSAAHPADAFVLAAVGLRRTLPDEPTDPIDARFHGPRVDRAEWDVLAAQEGPTSQALAAAIRALDVAEEERNEARADRHDRWLLRTSPTSRTSAERDEACRRQRERGMERLAAANVQGFENKWSSDAFGFATDHEIPLPALVLATTVTCDVRDLRHRFDGGRRWIALEHKMSNGWDSSYVVLIATIIEPGPTADRSLRHLPLRVPQRDDTIAHLCSYRDATHELLGAGVTVDDQRGFIGGGCWPFDLDSIASLTDGAIVPEDLSSWTTRLGDHLWPFDRSPSWQLLLLAPPPEEW